MGQLGLVLDVNEARDPPDMALTTTVVTSPDLWVPKTCPGAVNCAFAGGG
jgi:hypothetical protein